MKTIIQNKQHYNFIITFISYYREETYNLYLFKIYDILLSFYNNNKIFWANRCGENIEYIHKFLILDCKYKIGKIIIYDWVNIKSHDYNFFYNKIEEKYGYNNIVINSTYHALVYIELFIETKIFIAIETTIKFPYKLQFLVGNTFDELENLIKKRYLCNNFEIITDIKQNFLELLWRKKQN